MNAALTTGSDDYGKNYYASHLGSTEDYDWDTPAWRGFFSLVAERLVAILNPTRSLDVGCAKGLLVQALRANGVQAFGTDISEHAINSSHEDVREFLEVANSVEPFAGRWDLISCIEVLEHMSPADAERSIDNMCAASDQILISSTAADFNEPSHINVRPLPFWVASFAERGFYRRTDVDLSFITPWAVLFEKADLTTRDLAFRYESYSYPLRVEVLDKRKALLEASRTGAFLTADEVEALRQRVSDLELEILNSRDHARGAEAAAATANHALELSEKNLRDLKAHAEFLEDRLAGASHKLESTHDHNAELLGTRSELSRANAIAENRIADLARMLDDAQRHLDSKVAEMTGSPRWRVGGAILSPARLAKRLARGK